MGLAIANEVARAHGGARSVRSQLGEGSGLHGHAPWLRAFLHVSHALLTKAGHMPVRVMSIGDPAWPDDPRRGGLTWLPTRKSFRFDP